MIRCRAPCAQSPEHVAVPPAQRGMTLIEILVVLAIIAITASVTILSIGSDGGVRGRVEAKRLEARLQLAADQMMVGDRPVAMTVTADGYGFVERDGRSGQWRPFDDPVLGDRFALPEGMRLRNTREDAILQLGADGAGRPFTLILEAQERRWTIAFDGMTARLSDGGFEDARSQRDRPGA